MQLELCCWNEAEIKHHWYPRVKDSEGCKLTRRATHTTDCGTQDGNECCHRQPHNLAETGTAHTALAPHITNMLRTSTNVVASQRRGLVLPTPHSRLVAVGAVKQAAKPASKPAAKPVAKSQVVQKGRKQEVPQKQEESTITIPIVNMCV